jgi:hypothetical protein
MPPVEATDAHPRLARTLDVPAPLSPPRPGDPPPASRPYVIELHPDVGFSSLVLAAFDLLAALEGVNAAGLVVLAMFDGEAPPTPGDAAAQPGLDAPQTVRHLLDSCATSRDAREELLSAHRDPASRARWVVADRSGDAFVFEAGAQGGEVRSVASPELSATAGDPARAAPGERTLWHGLYDARARTLDASFLVREVGAVRSASLSFQLAA